MNTPSTPPQPVTAPARVAFIGLGAMGLPMARNLRQAGFDVHGFDVRPEASQRLADDDGGGGVAPASIRAAFDSAHAAVLMVVDAQQARDALFAGDAIDALRPGALVVLTSTCPPSAVQALAADVAARGRHLVDAPVSGGVAGARGGTLTIMAAAPQPLFDAARPLLDALGKRIFHVGTQAGQGATAKAVNQLLCGVHIAVAAEGLTLAERVGIDPQVMLDILGGSAAASWMLNDRGPRMLQHDPDVTSAVDIFVKDLSIVLDAGRDTKSALPLAAAAHQMFLATSGFGAGAADDSQVTRAYRALNPRRTR